MKYFQKYNIRAEGKSLYDKPSYNGAQSAVQLIPLYVLFIAYFLYQLQGVLYTSGVIISQSLLFVVITIDLIYFIKSMLFKRKDSFYYLLTVFFLLNIFGFFLWGGDLHNQLHFSMLKGIVLCIATFYPAYYMARIGILRGNDLLFFFFLQLIVSIVSFFYSSFLQVGSLGFDEEIVNNEAYDFVFLIPFLFLIVTKRKLSYIILFVLIFFIIQGAKRGAIIVGTALVFIYFYNEVRNARYNKRQFKNLLLVFITIGIIGYVVYKLNVNSDFLATRFESAIEGNYSGRDYIYKSIWEGWLNASHDLGSFLFGFGFAGSLQFTGGKFAHNDWLEALSNFGLVGVIIYLSLIVKGFSCVLGKSWGTHEDRILLFAIMTAWFFTSLFSMWYTSLSVLTQTMLLGYLMGKNTGK